MEIRLGYAVAFSRFINCTEGKFLGGFAAPQTPTLFKIKRKTLGLAQTHKGDNLPWPIIIKAFFVIYK
ncbi:MAG: hypothetical protein HQL71_10710 [Magnetococcales bacterium]|nr:hypothetical protein [Magnetococcales bacterium]